MSSLPSAIKQYLIEKGYSEYKTIRLLTDVDAAKDPENEPYRSMYKARKLLENMLYEIQQDLKIDGSKISRALEAALLFQIATNYLACEERPTGEKLLQNCISVLLDDPSIAMNMEAVSIAMSANMELGILNSNRYQNADQAFSLFTKVETIYHEYKHADIIAPLSVDELLRPTEEMFNDEQRKSKFERIFTHTLFYLAQVHKQLGHYDLSASYCQKTLRKQLLAKEYEPSEWAINAAGLSQYFITKNMFPQAKHCLCCANTIVEEVRNTTTAESDDSSATNNAKLQHKSDIARCWVKYYLALLENSKEKLYDDVCELDTVKQAKACSQIEPDEKTNISELEDDMLHMPVDVGAEAEMIAHQDVITIKQAKVVFAQCKKNLDFAFLFFQLDGYVTDHIELAQDTSSLYKHLIFFEPNPELKCKMHKRRVDILSGVLQDINPQFYLLLCRQLQFELGETYSNMVDLKIEIANSANVALSQHSVKKINKLCNDSMKYFNEFLNTLKSVGNIFPDKFDRDVERPALLAHFYLARLHSKIITRDQGDKVSEMKLIYQNYKFITDYVTRNPECKPHVLKEYEICQDMIELLPRSMNDILSKGE